MMEIQKLIPKAQRGNIRAFRNIVEQTYQYAYALAYRFLRNVEDSEDIVQESYIRIWRHMDEYKPTGEFTTWMYTIITNLSLDALRRRKREQKLINPDLTTAEIATPQNESEGDPGLFDSILNYAAELSPKQKLVFVLRDLQGLSIRETAKVLTITPGAVKTNLHLARKALKGQLEPQNNQDS